MPTNPSPRVFDDENDRWIEVREGETDRDALLRAQQHGAPSVTPPRRPSPAVAQAKRTNRPLKALTLISVIGLGVGVLFTLISAAAAQSGSLEGLASASILGAFGSMLVILGAVAGLLALTVAAIIEGFRPPRD